MNPVTHTRIPQQRRMAHHAAVDIVEDHRGQFMRRPGYAAGYGIHGFAAAPAAEMDFTFVPGRRS